MAAGSSLLRHGIFSVILVLDLLVIFISAVPTDPRGDTSMYQNKEKRPFCNAFTGCGKKRSIPLSGPSDNGDQELDFLTKLILTKAHLWDQLQNKVEALLQTPNYQYNYQYDDNQGYRQKRSLLKVEKKTNQN